MRYKRFFRTATAIGIAVLALSGCALVQWLPLSSCDHVKYERNGNEVQAEASCRL
jgi:hypothetical protein